MGSALPRRPLLAAAAIVALGAVFTGSLPADANADPTANATAATTRGAAPVRSAGTGDVATADTTASLRAMLPTATTVRRRTTTTKKKRVTTKATTTTVPAVVAPPVDAAASTTLTPTTLTPTTLVATPTAPAASTLAFTTCSGPVECAKLKVPLDPSNPAGQQITLFVSRRKANQPANRLGVLFVNPGGPGGPAYDLVRNISLVLGTEVLDRYDVIGVDPRGTDRSTPLTCDTGPAQRTLGLSVADRVRASFSALAKACGASAGSSLDFLDTQTAARDLDAVRVALGEERISFVGLSYGTFLGATYQRLFPTHTARMILDSAITPERFGNFMFLDRAAAKEAALDGFLAACANGQLNPCAFNDGTDLVAKYARVRSAYIAKFTNASSGATSFDQIIDSLVGYPRNGWPVLGRALQEVAATGNGNFRVMPGDAQSRDDRERQAPEDTFSDLTNLAINCRDGILPRDITSYDAITSQIPTVAPRFSGISSDFALAALTCLDWPAALVTSPTPTPQGIATLVIANRFDLTTPLTWSRALAADLAAPLLVREGGGHVALDKSDCVRDLATRFLVDATPGLATTSCPG